MSPSVCYLFSFEILETFSLIKTRRKIMDKVLKNKEKETIAKYFDICV